jgi:hypothetical protein
MADKDNNFEERKVEAYEKMAKAFGRIADALEERNDYNEDVGLVEWSERLEWYLNEFFQIFKTRTKGSINRPERGSERIQENKETQGEEDNS